MTDRNALRAEIVSIGNSRGLRIPKAIREEIGLESEVTLTVSKGALVVRPARAPRWDWRRRFEAAANAGHEPLLIPGDLENEFDVEWTW